MGQYAEDTPLLVGQAGPLSGQRWMLRGELLVGRDSNCDISIPSRQVSRHHARLKISDSGVILEDLDSKNGTHLNGSPIEEPVLLTDGDLVQIAFAQQFIFLSSDATLPLEISEEFLPALIHHGRLRMDKKSRQVWIRNEEIDPPLSASQFQLLELLYENEGKVVSRKDLIALIWGDTDAFDVSEQALDALVRRLRDRLGSVDPSHHYVLTVRGHGLRFDNPSE